MTISMTWVSKGIANLRKAQVGTILKNCLTKMGNNWHELYLPKRFTADGQNRYHLKKRTSKYIRWIKRKNPAWVPLVASGNLKASAMTNWRSQTATRGGQAKVTVKMVRTHPTLIYVSQELVKVNQNEVDELILKYKEDFMNECNVLKENKESGDAK